MHCLINQVEPTRHTAFSSPLLSLLSLRVVVFFLCWSIQVIQGHNKRVWALPPPYFWTNQHGCIYILSFSFFSFFFFSKYEVIYFLLSGFSFFSVVVRRRLLSSFFLLFVCVCVCVCVHHVHSMRWWYAHSHQSVVHWSEALSSTQLVLYARVCPLLNALLSFSSCYCAFRV